MRADRLVWTWCPEPEHLKERADRVILDALTRGLGDWEGDEPRISRSRLQSLMREGRVTQDGKPLKASQRLSDSPVQLSVPTAVPLEAMAEDLPIEILHE